MNTIRNFSRMPLIRHLRADSHPMPSRPRKLNHLRSRVPSNHLFFQLHCVRLMCEGSHLHTPMPARIGIRSSRCRKRFHSHLRHSSPIHTRRLRSRERQIDDPPANKRPTVGDLHHRRLIRAQVCHPNHRSHRQGQMRRRHCVLVVHLSIGSFASGIRRTIPARDPNLRRDRFAHIIRDGSREGNRRGRIRSP